MLYAPALLADGLALIIFSDPPPPGTDGVAAFGPRLAGVFEGGDNAVRVALLALSGLVLAFGALRAAHAPPGRGARPRAGEPGAPLLATDRGRDPAGQHRRAGPRPPSGLGVLFADIRGFTALSEGVAAEEVVQLLGAFRSRAREVIEGHGGVVDKFIGDAVMGVFGTPVPDGREATNTLAAALALRDVMLVWGRERERAGLGPRRSGSGRISGPSSQALSATRSGWSSP